MDDFKPRHTKIEKVINTVIGNVILENPVGYARTESNLYCISAMGQLVWSAELPEPGVLYSRVKFDDQGEKLVTYSTRGHACEIHLKTGKLLSKILMQ
jgi:hypothetical protein